jgi:hypothetical protein
MILLLRCLTLEAKDLRFKAPATTAITPVALLKPAGEEVLHGKGQFRVARITRASGATLIKKMELNKTSRSLTTQSRPTRNALKLP